MDKLLIIGAGGLSHVVTEMAHMQGKWGPIHFLDDDRDNPIAVGTCEEYLSFVDRYHYAIPAFGDNMLRMEWINRLTEAGFEVPTMVHPTAYVSPSAVLGAGCVLSPHCVVQTNSVVGIGCVLGAGAIVEHDTILENAVQLSAGVVVGSDSRISRGTMLDIGESVKRCTTI